MIMCAQNSKDTDLEVWSMSVFMYHECLGVNMTEYRNMYACYNRLCSCLKTMKANRLGYFYAQDIPTNVSMNRAHTGLHLYTESTIYLIHTNLIKTAGYSEGDDGVSLLGLYVFSNLVQGF